MGNHVKKKNTTKEILARARKLLTKKCHVCGEPAEAEFKKRPWCRECLNAEDVAAPSLHQLVERRRPSGLGELW